MKSILFLIVFFLTTLTQVYCHPVVETIDERIYDAKTPKYKTHPDQWRIFNKWVFSVGPGEAKMRKLYDFANCMDDTWVTDEKAWAALKGPKKLQSKMYAKKNQMFLENVNKCVNDYKK